MSNPVTGLPIRESIIKQFDEVFKRLKEIVGIADITTIAQDLDKTEELLGNDKLLDASKKLRELDINIEVIKKHNDQVETAKMRHENRQLEAKTAMTAALEAVSALQNYNPTELEELAKYARPEYIEQGMGTAQALLEELQQVVRQYERSVQSPADFTLQLKNIEDRAKAARAVIDRVRTGKSSTIIGWVIIAVSLFIVFVIAYWGKPGIPGAFLERVPWSVLLATSFGVLFMIMGVMSEKMNEFDKTKVPDYFHRFAQAWVYTILLTLVMPVSYTVDLETTGTTTNLPLDDILVGFFVGMFVYQVEKALKEVGVRLLPIEKFIERKQLTQPSAWVDTFKTERKTLFEKLNTAIQNKSVDEPITNSLLERFKDVDAKIASGDETAARSALDNLTVELNRATTATGKNNTSDV
jgi:hypothetical protein